MNKQTIRYFLACTGIGALWLLFLFSFICCSDDDRNKESNDIVLIFENWVNDYSVFEPKLSKGRLVIEGDILSIKPLERNAIKMDFSESMSDTVIIHLEGESFIVKHRYYLFSSIEFLMSKGDTIIVSKVDNLPFLHLKNRIIKPYDLNYEYYKNKRYELNSLNDEDYFRSLDNKDLLKFEDEQTWLDSLKKENLISEREYKFYYERNKYKVLEIKNIDDGNKTKEDYKELLSQYNDSFFYNDKFNFYRNYYIQLAGKYYLDKIIMLPNSKYTDYKYSFDNMEAENLITGDLRQFLIAGWLPKIVKMSPVAVGKEYYEKVLVELTDTTLINSLKNEFEEVFDEELLNSKALELLDRFGHKVSFENLIEKNAGKVVYVDFWASWCEPCLREMPAAEKLREKYTDKDVVFVYLTLDDKKEAWTKAIGSAILGEVSNNYFILNMRTSPLFKNLKITTIPRYLIYDKKGKLVHAEAPSPSSDEISKLLDKYLEE